MADIVSDLKLDEFDLVFLDDSKTADARIKTIEKVVSSKLKVPLVIHDYQYMGYRRVAEPHFEHSIIYSKVEKTHCAILWNGSVTDKSMSVRISQYLDDLPIEITNEFCLIGKKTLEGKR